MAKPEWRIYYDDASTWDSSQGDPWDAPRKDGVIAVLHFDKRQNWRILHKHDWYYYLHDTNPAWWGGDLTGLLYQFKYRPRLVLQVFEGALAEDSVYQDVMGRAIQDKAALLG